MSLLMFLGACKAPEVTQSDDASVVAELGHDWSGLDGVDITLTGGGGVYVPVPVLEVETPTPGEVMRLRASGLSAGQPVAFFAGQHNTGGGCGTYVPAALRRYFGNCLAIIGAIPVGDLAVADWNGEAMVEVTVPATFPLGRTIAFEAVSPAGPLTTRSLQVTSTTVGTKADCSFEGTSFETMQGAENVIMGELVCTAIGGDFVADEMLMRSRYYYGFPLYENVSVWAGNQLIASEPWNGTETHLELAYEIEEGATVRFRVEADFVQTGADYYSDALIVDYVDGEDESGDYVRWLGDGSEDVVYVTIAPHEYFWASLSPESPLNQYVLPGREHEIGIWEMCGDLGEVDLEGWIFELTGDTRMYASFRLSDGMHSHSAIATGDVLEFDDTDFTVPADMCTVVSLYGTTSEHVSEGGFGETGDSVIPSLVRVDGIGDASGEFITWTGWESAYSMTFAETTVTAHRSGAVVGGYLVPGTLPVLGLNLSASTSEDAVITRLEFEMEGDGAWRACGNTPVLEEAVGGVPVDGTWTAYAPTGWACSGSTPVNHFTLEPDNVVIPRGYTGGYELWLDAAGVVEGDTARVVLTEMCWRAWGDTVEVCTQGQGGLPLYGPTFAN